MKRVPSTAEISAVLNDDAPDAASTAQQDKFRVSR